MLTLNYFDDYNFSLYTTGNQKVSQNSLQHFIGAIEFIILLPLYYFTNGIHNRPCDTNVPEGRSVR